ncbi:MAG: Uma2 family endonuclease [Chloroflexota bacterium]|nr:Uma2 family endonuclease [Chloroflexota bacterium]
MTLTLEKRLSADELARLPDLVDDMPRVYELSEGKLIEMAPASAMHGRFAAKLTMKLLIFVENNDLGEVTAAETGHTLHRDPINGDTVRAPDVGFIRRQRFPKGLPETGYVPGAPDLAIEVMSPYDTANDIERKVAEYLRFGTRIVWVFYPQTRSVMIHTPTRIVRFTQADTLDGGDLLPGFSMALTDIFPVEPDADDSASA